MSDYLVWTAGWRDGLCRLTELRNVERQAEVRYNHSRAKGWPGEAEFAMNPDFPDDTELADCLANRTDLLVVSSRVVQFLRGAEVGPVEFLPVRVLDHRGKAVDGGYHIVNPLQPVDCLDMAASEPRMSNMLPDKVSRVKKLVLDPRRIDTMRRLFCCLRYHDPRLVHRTLAAAIDKAGFTGIRWVELGAFRG